MVDVTVSAEGEITLPDDVLEHLGSHLGGEVRVELLPGGRVAMRRAVTGKISDAFNFFYRKDGPSFTIEEINEAIEKGWAGEG